MRDSSINIDKLIPWSGEDVEVKDVVAKPFVAINGGVFALDSEMVIILQIHISCNDLFSNNLLSQSQ